MLIGRTWWIGLATLALAAAGSSSPATAAHQVANQAMRAPGGGETPPEPPPHCLDRVDATFSAWPPTVLPGQTSTLTWSVGGGGTCSYTVSLHGEPVGRSGTRVKTVLATTTYQLTAHGIGRSKSWFATVRVGLPPRDQYGRINVTITANNQASLFVEAVGTRDTTVRIASGVALNLSGRGEIPIFPGVQILGTRSSLDPGPLLFTTSAGVLLTVGEHFEGTPERHPADNVRISGLRIEGPDQSHADSDASGVKGILISGSINVEIDNNEIFGFRTAAVQVNDERGRIDRFNGAGAVRIHGNFIHHNQQNEKGYGVVIGGPAYALIEKNVFDYNRHAIAGDGADESGYFVYRNLILENGGYHDGWGPFNWRTHQIDMHGQQTCWGYDASCGPAGEYMDVRYNAIRYTAGTAVKLRGNPAIAMDVRDNVFAHEDEGDAIEQTVWDPNLRRSNNTFGASFQFVRPCDFDGDTVADTFLATGQTWWFASDQGQRGFRFLNTSTAPLSQLSFGDENGDGRCDVRAGDHVSWGGTTPLPRVERTDILTRNASSGQLRISTMSGGVMGSDVYHTLAPNRDVLATGDFDGDGDSDLLLSEALPLGFIRTSLWLLQDGAVASYGPTLTVDGGTAEGAGDFDGDGTDDVLWRTKTGALELWRWNDVWRSQRSAITWRNGAGSIVGLDWDVKAVGDFNGDGYADIAWRHDNGQVSVWLMASTVYTGEFYPGGPNAGLPWKIAGVGDFDADGRSDLLWRYFSGELAIWFGAVDPAGAYPTWRDGGVPTDLWWQIQGVSDFNGDGRSDILWRAGNGHGSIWLMNGGSNIGEPPYHYIDNVWQTKGLLTQQP